MSHGRRSLDGSEGPTPQVTLRLPHELRGRALQTARWRRTSLAVLLREALERHLDRQALLDRAHAEARAEAHERVLRAAQARWWSSASEPVDGLAQAYADGDAGVVAEEE
jgi:predicted DNA-binding protein